MKPLNLLQRMSELDCIYDSYCDILFKGDIFKIEIMLESTDINKIESTLNAVTALNTEDFKH